MSTSTIIETLQKLAAAAEAAAAAVTKDGSSARGSVRAAVMEEDLALLKRCLPGSLLELASGHFGAVPGSRGVIDRAAGPVLRVHDGDGGATERDTAWLNANVKKVWLGVLAFNGGAGDKSRHVVAGVPATLSPVSPHATLA